MALAGELANYIGNEMIKTGGKELAKAGTKSALSSLVPSVATKAGTSLLNQATALGLSRNNANKWILNTSILDTDEGVGKIKDFMNPILGGDKTPSYQRFLEQIGEGEYQMGHRPSLYVGDSETKFPLSNMEADPDYLPKIYGDNEASTVRNLLMLGNTGPDAQMSAKIIAQYQNQPDKMVKIFRQAPKDMNYGDWVGLTKEYADNHIGNSPNNQLWEREVPASEVMFAGDDINEWGYYPKEVQLDDEIANELNKAIEMSGADMSVAKRADSYLGGRMLDKNGKPMTFYHSTPYEFDKFDDSKLGQNTNYTNTALGHFITTDKDFSRRFIDVDNVGKTGRTMELYAKAKKPIIHPYLAGQKYPQEQLDEILKNWIRAISDNEETANEIIQDHVNAANETRELMESSGQVYDTKSPLWDEYMNQTFMGTDPYEYSADDRKALLRNGYDAVEIVEGPKSGLVEGSKDDSVVSSYAILNGDNLSQVRHIPVQQDNYVPLYHQTSANSLADFSLDKRNAGLSDATMPEGIFLKDTDADIGLPGKNQLQLDAKLNNPLVVMNRDDLKAKLMAMNPKVAKYLRAETDLDNYYGKLSEEAQDAVDKAYEKMYYDKSDANKKAFTEANEKMNGIIPEWREKIKENAATSQKEIKKLLKENGYDGMIMDEDKGSFGRKVKSYLVLDKEQLRDNSVPVKFVSKLGKELNSVAKAMREYKDKNMKNMADKMIDSYDNDISDWGVLREKGEKAIEKMVGKDGLENLKTFVEPVVNNASKAGEYEMNKTIATNFLNSADSDWIVEYSKELLPPGTKIYRRGSKTGISWTTNEALAKSSKYDGELLEHTLTEDDRYIAPQFIDILQRTIENEDQVLFSLNSTNNPNILYSKNSDPSITELGAQLRAMKTSKQISNEVKRVGSSEVAEIDKSTLPKGYETVKKYIGEPITKVLEEDIGKAPIGDPTSNDEYMSKVRRYIEEAHQLPKNYEDDVLRQAEIIKKRLGANELRNQGATGYSDFIESRLNVYEKKPESRSLRNFKISADNGGEENFATELDKEYSDRLGIGRSHTPMENNSSVPGAGGFYYNGGIGIAPNWASGEIGVSDIAHERMHAMQYVKRGEWDDRVVDAIEELREELKKHYHSEDEIKKFHNTSNTKYYADKEEQEARMLQSYLENEGYTNSWRKQGGYQQEWGDEIKPAFDKFYKRLRELSKIGVALPAIALLFGLSTNGGDNNDKIS